MSDQCSHDNPFICAANKCYRWKLNEYAASANGLVSVRKSNNALQRQYDKGWNEAIDKSVSICLGICMSSKFEVNRLQAKTIADVIAKLKKPEGGPGNG